MLALSMYARAVYFIFSKQRHLFLTHLGKLNLFKTFQPNDNGFKTKIDRGNLTLRDRI